MPFRSTERSSETRNAILKRERYSDIKTHFRNRNAFLKRETTFWISIDSFT